MRTAKDYRFEEDEDGNGLDAFAEILVVMDVEQLIRFRHRLKKVGRKRMVEILSEEIIRRGEEEEAYDRLEEKRRGGG